MGIKSINAFLLKKLEKLEKQFPEYPKAFKTVYLSEFSGHRIAIDAYGYIYTIMSTATSDVVSRMTNPLLEEIDRSKIVERSTERLFNFVTDMATYGILPVWVWDGQPLKEKDACKQKRRQEREKALNKIEEAKRILLAKHPLERTSLDTLELKKLLSRYINIFPDEMKHFRDIIKLYGFPSIQAPYEGEKMCASLAMERFSLKSQPLNIHQSNNQECGLLKIFNIAFK